MSTSKSPLSWLVFLLALCSVFRPVELFAQPIAQEERNEAYKLYSSGNYKESFEAYRKLILSKNGDLDSLGSDIAMANSAANNLGNQDQMDEFLEEILKARPNSWRVNLAVAYGYSYLQHNGSIVAGKFNRGKYDYRSKNVDSTERDRIRSLQLLVEAIPLSKTETDPSKRSELFARLADTLSRNRNGSEAWMLQHLSDLSKLPDYEDYNVRYSGSRFVGAPVSEKGEPIFYAVPKDFESAKNDGERYRWALTEQIRTNPSSEDGVRYQFAQFLDSQFGVSTLQNYGFFKRASDPTDTGTFALHTLSDDETIARFATGIKRVKLPDEFNPVKIYTLLADSKLHPGYAEASRDFLCQNLLNRRQYPRAAACYTEAIKEFGPGSNEFRKTQLSQIVGSFGQFEPLVAQAVDEKALVEYRFRNGTSLALEAYELNVDLLLEDTKQYLKDNPASEDYQKVNFSYLGQRIVNEHETRYIGKKAASWKQELNPRKNHFDTRVTIDIPIKKAGAYLLSAKIAGGNESKIIVWIADGALIQKPLDKGVFYYFGDANNGSPIPEAKVEFFGYKREYISDRSLVNKISGRTSNIITSQFTTHTDSNGQIILDEKRLSNNFQWIAIAKASDGRKAFLGFSNVWYQNYYDYEYNQTKGFIITDRPVYRPEQTTKFKVWLAHAKYDLNKESAIANSDVSVRITYPNGETFLDKTLHTDKYGGADAEFQLPKNAQLGLYHISLLNYGASGTFRVEEYKKPEFEVTVEAPTEPIMLGEKISAKISAKYYFGAPVTEAKVKYKVLRSGFEASWYPTAIWDWFYGVGYWWFSYDYTWFPGWRIWGCKRPIPWWWTSRTAPPELLIENEVPIGKDGTYSIEIDTQAAKELHGDYDQRYQISVEVVDQSRRTIDGSGEVLAAREPFKVYTWVDRGHYQAGDTVQANFKAQTVSNKPVEGTGNLKLLKVSYQNGKPNEEVVQEWKLDTNDRGEASAQIKAASAGQYRLSYAVTDKKSHQIEGGYLFTVIGSGFDGKSYKFNDIELIPDKKEYAAGDKLRLMINTEVPDSSVILFVRPSNGVYLKPEIINISGKSVVKELEISRKDMPNIFFEAVTISEGRVLNEVKEIVVPPEQRVLNVEVKPSQERFKPGEEAKVLVRLTDLAGKPYTGSTVLSVYDKAVEYISGGSNVPNIKEFFWKWRRNHHSSGYDSLDIGSTNLSETNEKTMQFLGIFGQSVADEETDAKRRNEEPTARAKNKRQDFALRKSVRASSAFSDAEGMGGVAQPASMLAEEKGDVAKDELSSLGAKELNAAAPAKSAGGETAVQQPKVRAAFADTAFWVASLNTNENGEAEVKFSMPENLSEWKMKVWAMGEGTKVGQGEASAVTAKNVIVRLQAPRFFVEKDEVILSANIHNYLPTEKTIEGKIDVDAELMELLDHPGVSVTVPSNGEKRVDWRVKILKEGQAKIRMSALTTEESDAMEMTIPVKVHGILKTESWSGAVRPEQNSGKIKIKVPSERRPEQTKLEIRYSPSLASAMVDALPYLVSYPYGCTEQTLNRFLPTVITQKILKEMGLNLREISDKRTNLNAQEIGNDRERAKQWKRFPENPVFDENEVKEMIKAGLDRLAAMQLSDGGWGWFSGSEEHSYSHTTAVVVHGLQIAKDAGANVDNEVLQRGISWLKHYQAEEIQKLKNAPSETKPYKRYADDIDAFVQMILVDADVADSEMREFLYRDKTHLSVYTKSMFGISLFKEGQKDKLKEIMRNLSQYLVEDQENQTAYLKLPNENYWWYWYGSEIEAQSYYLKLLAKVEPKGTVASGLAKFLINNRKHATYWNSTRDSANAIEALADYIRASGESAPNLSVEVLVDGKKMKEVKITKENLFTFDNQFVIEGADLTSGEHQIDLKKTGAGPLYFNAYLANFTLEDFITKAGLEIKVNRKFYKLTRSEDKVLTPGSSGQALQQKQDKYDRREISLNEVLKSGDLIEVELEIDSKNDYEYLIFEDLKAAGFEAEQVRSGYTPNDLGAYVEYRDDRVSFFTRALGKGKHSVSYRLRAEIPGKFSALPTIGYAMYAPELKANSDEMKLGIQD